MKLEKLSAWAEIISSIAIVLTLVYLSIQTQQNTAATRSATVLQLKDSWVQLNLVSATSVELADALQEVRELGLNDASYQSKALVTGFYRTLFHNWSNAYYHYQIGTLEDVQWSGILNELSRGTKNQTFIQVWSDWSFAYDDAFRQFVDALITDAKLETESEANPLIHTE